MASSHTIIGVGLLVFILLLLMSKYARTAKRGAFRWWGWMGLAVLALAETLLFFGVAPVTIFFTPIAWTGYLLLADALVARLRAESLLSQTPQNFFALAFWSVPLWLIFEAYNLRLQNWTYIGMPVSPWVGAFGCAWAFGTIWPAIFETADLLRALGWFARQHPIRPPLRRSTLVALASSGLALVIVPLLVPQAAARYLFGAVWIGFILLLDPLNYLSHARSLLRDWEEGLASNFWSYLTAGLVCGVLWEFWNYWAAAKWWYIFPIAQRWKIFEMPLPGYLGFAPFGLECLVMYEFIGSTKRWLRASRRGLRHEAPAPAVKS